MDDSISEEVQAARRGRKPKSISEEVQADDAIADEVTVIRAAKAKEEPKLFPVVLKRNYHPVNDFLIAGEKPTLEQRVKVFAGTAIDMDINEAKAIIEKGIAVRNDPIS
jgi:hypothetical protein